MKIFTSLDDVIAAIHGGFCLGARTFKTPMVNQHPNNGRTTIWVTCGIPGVGKTTISEAIRSAYPPFQCAVVARDEIRTDLLWDIRKMDPEIQEKSIAWMDRMTSWEVQERLQRMLQDEKKTWSAIVVDGCHTEYNTLESLLMFLEQFGNKVIIHLLIIGDDESLCFHAINARKEGDYSDYGPQGHHQSIPDCVVKRKREEMKDLLENHFGCLVQKVDDIYWLRECAGRPQYSETYRKNQFK